EASTRTVDLGLADGFQVILQRDDGGHHVAGLDAGVKALHLAVDDSFGKFRLLPAAGNMGGDRLLQIVNVVNEDAVQFVHLRVNIARDSNVDKEHGTILAAAEEHFAMLEIGRASCRERLKS